MRVDSPSHITCAYLNNTIAPKVRDPPLFVTRALRLLCPDVSFILTPFCVSLLYVSFKLRVKLIFFQGKTRFAEVGPFSATEMAIITSSAPPHPLPYNHAISDATGARRRKSRPLEPGHASHRPGPIMATINPSLGACGGVIDPSAPSLLWTHQQISWSAIHNRGRREGSDVKLLLLCAVRKFPVRHAAKAIGDWSSSEPNQNRVHSSSQPGQSRETRKVQKQTRTESSQRRETEPRIVNYQLILFYHQRE